MLAWDYYKKALDLIGKINIRQEITTYNNLGEVTCWLGIYDQSQQHTEQGLRLAVQCGDRVIQSMLLLNLSIAEIDRGNVGVAEFYLKRSLKLCREIGNRREEGTVLHNLACLAGQDGRFETAESLFNQALTIRMQLDTLPFIAEDQAGLAWVAFQQGNHEEARTLAATVCQYLAENPAAIGAYKPLKLYQNLYQVAQGLDGSLAAKLLNDARAIINSRADAIPDPAVREAYLTRVPENLWLMQAVPPT
jgi:ATP/maltotriose-dependent transcriptional regulator MalT